MKCGIELQAVGRRRNLVELLHCPGNVFRRHTREHKSTLTLYAAGAMLHTGFCGVFREEYLMEPAIVSPHGGYLSSCRHQTTDQGGSEPCSNAAAAAGVLV